MVVVPSNEKDWKGQIAEAAFVFLGLTNALVIWKPVNPQLKYDFIVERPSGARFRIQVKSAWKERYNSWRCDITKKRKVGGEPVIKKYTDQDFDILAVYHPEKKDFWIFPVQDIIKKTSVWCRTEKVANPNGFDSSKYWQRWSLCIGV